MKYLIRETELSDHGKKVHLDECSGDDESFSVPEGVTDIWSLENCPNLRSVEIPASVERVWLRFLRNCPQMRELVIDGNNPYLSASGGILYTEGGTVAKKWYACARRDVDLEISEAVKDLGYRMFADCLSIRSITLPASMRRVYNEVFRNCRNLTRVLMHNSSDPGKVIWLCQQAFRDCRSLRSFIVEEGAPVELHEGVFRDCSSLAQVQIPDVIGRIPENAFNSCTSLRSFEISEGITEVRDWAFDHCCSLEFLSLPASLENIGAGAFRKCESLASISIPDRVREVGSWAFSESGLQDVTIGSGLREIPDSMFRECTQLKSIVIPEKVRSIGSNAFRDCGELESVTLPDGLKIIKSSAFAGCRSLAHITIPGGVTKFGENVFAGCGLKSITHRGKTYRTEDGRQFERAMSGIREEIEKVDRLPKKKRRIYRKYPYMDEFEYLGRDSDEDGYCWRSVLVDEDYELQEDEREGPGE